MQLITLASGSSGNCILLRQGDAAVLVDAGISCRRITTALRALDVDPAALLGVLITHEHTDHIAGLATLTKRFHLPVYTSPGTAAALWYAQDVIHTVEPGRDFETGPFGVETFETSHDAAQPMGFAVSCGGRTAAVVTDLGYVSEEVLDGILGSHLVLCEANHDVEWLKTGPYPYYLKARILGDKGHLSNEAGAGLALQCVERGARTVVLAHLSAQNNTPARARAVAETVFRGAGIDPERDVTLSVAPRSEMSAVFEV